MAAEASSLGELPLGLGALVVNPLQEEVIRQQYKVTNLRRYRGNWSAKKKLRNGMIVDDPIVVGTVMAKHLRTRVTWAPKTTPRSTRE